MLTIFVNMATVKEFYDTLSSNLEKFSKANSQIAIPQKLIDALKMLRELQQVTNDKKEKISIESEQLGEIILSLNSLKMASDAKQTKSLDQIIKEAQSITKQHDATALLYHLTNKLLIDHLTNYAHIPRNEDELSKISKDLIDDCNKINEAIYNKTAFQNGLSIKKDPRKILSQTMDTILREAMNVSILINNTKMLSSAAKNNGKVTDENKQILSNEDTNTIRKSLDVIENQIKRIEELLLKHTSGESIFPRLSTDNKDIYFSHADLIPQLQALCHSCTHRVEKSREILNLLVDNKLQSSPGM